MNSDLSHASNQINVILYLSTFDQLLRNQLNSNLMEVSLEEELHTCRLYLKLKTLRFGDKPHYEFNIDPNADTHPVKIPSLLLRPFIENAMIHGLLPLPNGGISNIGRGNTSGQEGIEAIRDKKPNLVFLDISMPLVSGFQMLEQLRDAVNFTVIFTSAFDQFVLKALRVNTFDYLLKPVEPDQLMDTINRLKWENAPASIAERI